ncbi:MAG: hypothetical protein EAZ92_10390 [Candidatus Kapaibacterium sp.]|nr:MAG: hypothetical protein EAZ92_10390 [Candidatus Kapabacteria bacterium]
MGYLCLLLLLQASIAFAQYQTGGTGNSESKQPKKIPLSKERVLPPLPPAMQKAVDERLRKEKEQQKEQEKEGESEAQSIILRHDEEGSGETQSKPSTNALPPDTVFFGGIRWIARNTNERGEPFNTLFSGKPTEIFVDEQNKLHVVINKRDGSWYGVDVAADTSFGYGTYAFFAETKFDEFAPNVHFEFSITPDRAMDSYTAPMLALQCTRLYEQTLSPLRYLVANSEQNLVVERKEKVFRSDEPFRMGGLFSTHAITWKRRSCEFASYHDHGLPSKYLAALWDFSASPATGITVPEPTPTNTLRLRLWCAGTPIDNKPIEVVIKKIIYRSE